MGATPFRIVIAEDDPDIRRLTAITLRRRGYEVLEASDGDTALALIRSEHPDVAVLDDMMPGLSGVEVTRLLAADEATAGIPVVLASAKGQASELERGLASGARAYVVKPFAPADLAAAVAGCLPDRAPSG
jgi:CheY-like chemotaxis protein